jgi:6-phosphogluconolactonase
MTAPDGEFHVSADAEALARDAAAWLTDKALSRPGRFAICCSGGSTPKRLYELLAQPEYSARFPWPRVHWFWGDERFVPYDHPDSNYRMMHDALLAHAPVPPGNIHPVPTQGVTPEQSAEAYQLTLRAYYGAEVLDRTRPLFDTTLLGIGEDGHTASLFPGQSALLEATQWVVAVVGPKPDKRISLTFPVLDSSREVAFLAAGTSKQSIVKRVQSGDATLPAARVRPIGKLHWFVDRAAATS